VFSICWLQGSGATTGEQEGEFRNTAAGSELKRSLGLWALKLSSAPVRGGTRQESSEEVDGMEMEQ